MRFTRKRAALAAGGTALVAAAVAVPTTASQAAVAHSDTYYASVAVTAPPAVPAASIAKSFAPGGAASVVRIGAGDYRVRITGATVANCVTLANTNTNAPDTATAAPDPATGADSVLVHTFGPTNVVADLPVDLIVVC